MRIADDFGLGRGHDRMILSLLDSGRLDGTSVMVNDAIDAADIGRLKALRAAGAQVGLHLNLTQALPGIARVWTLGQLMRGRQPEGIAAALDRQVRAFAALFGDLPDYYDGHQHCHCLPAVRPHIARLPRTGATWLRLPLPATWAGRWLNLQAAGAKAAVVMGFAARARRDFARAGLHMNHDFSGFLHLDNPAQVRRWLPRLLQAARPDCLVMLHPGAADDPAQCPHHATQSRAVEAEILQREA